MLGEKCTPQAPVVINNSVLLLEAPQESVALSPIHVGSIPVSYG